MFWYEYEYATMPLGEVLPITSAVKHQDSYLSEDSPLQCYRELLRKGFRWVRSEEGQAIFERRKVKYPRTKD